MARYVFDHWEVNGVNIGSANPTTIGPITADITINAVYQIVIVQHTVSLESSPQGVPYTNPPGTAPFTATVQDGQNVSVQVPQQVEA